MKRLLGALAPALLSILLGAGCRRDPGERMGRKYDELLEIVQKHRASPVRAMREAQAWLTTSEKDLKAICEDRARLYETDRDAALKAAVDHMNHHRDAQQAIDRLIERWEPARRLELSALMVDLSQVCLPDAQKVAPFR